MFSIAALAFTVSGCVCLYLASPNQRWLARVQPAQSLLAAGCLLLAAGFAGWIMALRPLSGVAVALHVVMVCLFAFPYSVALKKKG